MREILEHEHGNVNLNLMDRKIIGANYVATGEIYKIKSLYDYLLVEAVSEKCDHLTIDGEKPDYDETKDRYVSGVGSAATKCILLPAGSEISGKFSSVKVLDGPASIVGKNLNTHVDVNFTRDFGSQAQNTTSFAHGIIAHFDASRPGDFLYHSSNIVSSWSDAQGGSARFQNTTSAESPARQNVDLSVVGGAVDAPAVTFEYNAGQYLYANGTDKIDMQPENTYWTFICAISGNDNLAGTILDRSDSGSAEADTQFSYGLNLLAPITRLIRTVGAVSDQDSQFDFNDTFSIIVSTAGYDTESGVRSEHFHAGSPLDIDSMIYSNHYDTAYTTKMGADNSGTAGAPGDFLNGNIHEMIILENRISVSEWGDYNLNNGMINAIGLYLKNKWVPDGGLEMWDPQTY